MKNNFKKNGNLRVWYETPEERREILRILEEQLGFRIDEEEKKITQIHPLSTRTFDINLKFKTIQYGVQPFIGVAMMSSGIRFYSAREFFRLAELGFRVVPRFPVFHVPHDGWQFPEKLMSSVCVPEEVFLEYHEKMRDTDIMRAVPEAYRGGDMCERFPVSRLLCDVERFIGEEEVMERYGMGFCYEKAYDGTRIKHITEDTQKKTLRYYRKHHERMDAICALHPRILLFDLHSYSDETVPEEFLKKGAPTPDLCVGTDERYTPPELLKIINRRFSEAGFSIAPNAPYAGCFVPGSVLTKQACCDFTGIMLEFNKRTYCTPDGKSIPEKLTAIRETIQEVINDCAEL